MKSLKETFSLCPVCRESVPAQVVQVGDEIELRKSCPAHGDFATVINSDAKHYHLSLGAKSREQIANALPVLGNVPELDSGCCNSGGCGTVEHLSTCIALIEIVRSCNLSCPTCFANSPHTHEIDALTYDEIVLRIEAVTARKKSIDILQLSGGEPTIHPEFFKVLRWCLANEKIGHVLLNTNGIKLASDEFFSELKSARDQLGKLEIYLQYDGPQAAGQVALRGVDLRNHRQNIIGRCQDASIPVNLAMTVDQHNLDHLGDSLRVAIENPSVSGITWQPMFGSGRAYDGFNGSQTVPLRNAKRNGDVLPAVQRPPTRRLNVADIIQNVVAQSNGVLCEQDFTPLPCGDPNCHTVGYLLRRGDELVGLSSLIDLFNVQGFLRDRMNFNLEDLAQCGCESEPLGEILKQLEIGPESILRLVIKPFMDVWTYDQHRVDRCCVHVIGEGGSLESFCHHYATA